MRSPPLVVPGQPMKPVHLGPVARVMLTSELVQATKTHLETPKNEAHGASRRTVVPTSRRVRVAHPDRIVGVLRSVAAHGHRPEDLLLEAVVGLPVVVLRERRAAKLRRELVGQGVLTVIRADAGRGDGKREQSQDAAAEQHEVADGTRVRTAYGEDCGAAQYSCQRTPRHWPPGPRRRSRRSR